MLLLSTNTMLLNKYPKYIDNNKRLLNQSSKERDKGDQHFSVRGNYCGPFIVRLLIIDGSIVRETDRGR